MAYVSKAVIIGGGFAGLAAGISLAKAGVQCDVLELAHEPHGAALGINGRAADALVELGVYDEVYETGRPWLEGSTAASIFDAQGAAHQPRAIPPVLAWSQDSDRCAPPCFSEDSGCRRRARGSEYPPRGYCEGRRPKWRCVAR